MHMNESKTYIDAGARAGTAARRRDWSLAQHERRWFREAMALEPEDYRRQAQQLFNAAYREAAR
jgi:hypothetical protein